METNKPTFKFRSFVGMVIAISGLGLPITGIANHFLGFDALTTARHAWMSAHNILSLWFVVFVILHVVLNRRAMWAHLRDLGSKIPSLMSREAMAAGALVLLSLALFVGHAFHAGGR
jgi:hypothetical protein